MKFNFQSGTKTPGSSTLRHIGNAGLHGPINCAAPGFIELSRLIEMIESQVGKKANLVAHDYSDKAHSPYGWDNDKYMDTTRLQKSGFSCEPSRSWLPDLISQLSHKISKQ